MSAPSPDTGAAARNVAWLTFEETTTVVAVPAASGRSAIIELIERIYHAESLGGASRARSILRERIHANYAAAISEREAVKVAAKRLDAPADRPPPAAHAGSTHVRELPEAPPLPIFSVPELAPGAILDRAAVPAALERLKRETTRARERWTSDRPVSALLVDRDGRFLAGAWNTNAVIRTRHAERNLCDSLGALVPEGKIPAGATLYVSLKPCRMCAARIWETAADPASLTVIYLENDPGPLAQGTLLEPRSPARVRYLGLDHPLFAAETSRLDSRANPRLTSG